MASFAGLNQDAAQLQQRIERFQGVREEILKQVRDVIVGQEDVVDQILIALFVGGHCLLTGMPGTAKTLMVRTIADTLGLRFRRIQFTPDLMPSDITGTDIIEEDLTTGHRKWTFVQGPIFGNILLADEINRTPPKTQSALLEAMQEHSCTVRGTNTAACAVLCAGHAEPDRTGRNVSATRGAVGPLPLQFDPGRLERRRRIEGGGPHHGYARHQRVSSDLGRGHARFPAACPHGAHCRNSLALCGGPGAQHAAQERKCARFCQKICELRGQRSRSAVYCAGRQGACPIA